MNLLVLLSTPAEMFIHQITAECSESIEEKANQKWILSVVCKYLLFKTIAGATLCQQV